MCKSNRLRREVLCYFTCIYPCEFAPAGKEVMKKRIAKINQFSNLLDIVSSGSYTHMALVACLDTFKRINI